MRDTSEENKKLLIGAVDSYLKPSIDVIVFMINQIRFNETIPDVVFVDFCRF
mgnify:CR=1 FL=1